MDARPIFPRFEIPLTKISLFEPQQQMIDMAATATQAFLKTITEKIEKNILEKFNITNPQAHIGLIASGDQFIKNPTSHQNLKFDSRNVLAVEMEGAAVAQVCHEHDISYIVICTISDNADHDTAIDFQSFIAKIASHYTFHIIKGFLQLKRDQNVRC